MNVLPAIKKNKKFLLILFLISFFIRTLFFVLFFSRDKNYWTGDSSDYNDVALQIAQGNGISGLDGQPNFWRVPGYALFLAFFYKFFTKDIKNILVFQILISSIIPILAFLLSIVFFPSNILLAKYVGILSSINLGFIMYSGIVMSEAIFLMFFLAFLILFCSSFNLFFCKICFSQYFSYKELFFAGIFLGIASLLRPVGQYLVFVSVLLLLFSSFSMNLKIKQSFCFIFGWLVVVMWWLLRNYCLSGGFIFFHTMPKQHFLNYVAIPIEMHINQIPFDKAQNKLRAIVKDKVIKNEQTLGRNLQEIEICKLTEFISFDYLFKAPIFACKRFILNLCKTCFDLHIIYQKKVFGNFFLCFLFCELLFMCFLYIGFFGFLLSIFKNTNLLCVFFKVLPIAVTFILLTAVEGFARLRLPIEPFLMIFSLYFWLDFLEKDA